MKCIQTVAAHAFSFLRATYARSPVEQDKLNWIVLFSPDPLFQSGSDRILESVDPYQDTWFDWHLIWLRLFLIWA